MTAWILTLVTAGVLDGGAAGGQKPEALRRAIEARTAQRLRTARIEFSVVERDARNQHAASSRFFTWLCAEDRYILVDRGGEEGIVARDAQGDPLPAALNRPDWCLVQDGQVWNHTEGALDAHVPGDDQRRMFSLYDLRELGLNPVSSGSDLEETLRQSRYPPLTYETEILDGLHVVTGTSNDCKVKWWIDPQKDWNVVRTEVIHAGKKIGEHRFGLRFDPYDGVWFPSRIEKYRLAAGDTQPSTVIQLHSTEFNRPDHPPELTPADVGIEVGTSIVFQDRDPPVGGYWDGQGTVPFEELMERIQSGELTMGPSVSRVRARLRAIGAREKHAATGDSKASADDAPTTQRAVPPAVLEWDRFETQWETYTRIFIARYHLDREQRQKAWSICDDCQQGGRDYVGQRRERFEELDKRIAGAKAATSPADSALRAEWDAQRQKLMEPLNRLFGEQLKPRLEQLPTRLQRELADPDLTP